MQTSGNHGRSNDEPPPTGIGNLVPSTTPQQSTRGFVAPSFIPIKKTPDITEIIGEERKENDNSLNPDFQKAPLIAEEQNLCESVESVSSVCEKNSPEIKSNFSESWSEMFEQVFRAVPTIYLALKDTLPEIENNIIKVTVTNTPQKEHFEAKTREVLEFLRTHFDEKIEDVVVEANEMLEMKKVIIYDSKEKLQNLKDQNPEIEDFLQISELKMKD